MLRISFVKHLRLMGISVAGIFQQKQRNTIADIDAPFPSPNAERAELLLADRAPQWGGVRLFLARRTGPVTKTAVTQKRKEHFDGSNAYTELKSYKFKSLRD